MRRLLVLGACLALAGVPAPASASCVAPPPIPRAIREASAVFVGTVVATTNGRRWVTVDVSDVWKGDVATRVEVKAGPKDPPGPINTASSVDRHYRLEETYLFFPHGQRSDVFRDTNCSRTTRYSPELERFRPPGAEDVSPDRTGDPHAAGSPDEHKTRSRSMVWPLIAAALTLAAVALVLLFVFVMRRRRT